MRTFGRLVLISMVALAVGCSKSEGGGSASTSVNLAKLALKADAPAESEVGDAIMGEGIMVRGPNLVATVEVASDSRPKTVKDAQEEASMYSPTNLKTENLPDGWVLTFQNKGDMGANYFVNVRREIGGKAYWCDTTCSAPEQQANALSFCKSLKKG
jgi:hypothetical protein